MRKVELLGRAEAEGWKVVFAHDPRCRMARIVKTERGDFTAETILSA